MSTLDTAQTRLADFSPTYYNENSREANAIGVVGAGLVAQAEEARIANLIALLPSLDSVGTRSVMTDLSKRLGLPYLTLRTES